MNMRKIIALLAAAALLMAFAGCRKTSEAEEPPTTMDGTVTVDAAKIVNSDEVTYPPFLQLLDNVKEYDKPLAESIAITRQQSYLDRWYRVLYLMFPEFTGIENAGKINVYYEEQARHAQPDEMGWLEGGQTLSGQESALFYYSLRVYATALLGPFAVVDFFTDEYLGGAHGHETVTADVFDTRTGGKVALGDLVDVGAKAGVINKAVADYFAEHGVEPFETYDVRKAASQNFTLTQDALVLLFPPGDIAPHVAGNIAVPLTWAQLGIKGPLA